jgi:hypothetical protein
MRDESVDADLEQISRGCVWRRLVEQQLFMPSQCSAPLADSWVRKACPNIVRETVANLGLKPQVCRDDSTDEPEAITGGDPAAVRPERAMVGEAWSLPCIFNEKLERMSLKTGFQWLHLRQSRAIIRISRLRTV